MLPRDLESYRRVQNAARQVLAQIAGTIGPESTESSLAETCIELLANQGIRETWYYSVPALVLLGSRSCLSMSGRDYVPSNEPVGLFNLVTIDLSPLDQKWGDLDRSFVIEGGKATESPNDAEFRAGLAAELSLHRAFCQVARPERTFEDIFLRMNGEIAALGFVNLDFMGNVGHSIVERREDRVYFEAGNKARLDSVDFFTFEPHIRLASGRWGFKHENIYFFDEAGRTQEL